MLLQAQSITKSFGAVRALKGVSFDLCPGEVHALIGENGAGKSTLIKVITGAHAADSGHLIVDGRTIAENSPSIAKALGIAAIYQQPALFPELSVAENLAIGLESGGFLQRIDWRARNRRARQLLDRIGATLDPEIPASSLSMPEQQLVEIARALGASARILIMDEPTASLSDRETKNLFRIIDELKQAGVGIIYISHRMDELFQIADRATVLRDGETIATCQMRDVDAAELIRLMVGREFSAVFPKREVPIGDNVLEVCNLSSQAAGIRNISFSVRAGEILGLAGLVGAGRTELARVLFGLDPADEGQILLRNEPVVIDSPARAVAHGIAYVPEDRRRHGAILELPIAANTSLAILNRISKFNFLDFKSEKIVAADFADRLSIKTHSIFSPAGTLSGGNQQKVALARWLATQPSVLILDEPTQGIDVGAKSEIHRLMCDLAEQGIAIVMISSELPEILGMSDRIAVMRGGEIIEIVAGKDATPLQIIRLALNSPAK